MNPSGRKFCAAALCLVGVAIFACGLTNAEPRWPQYGFDARHTLFNPFERTLNRSNVAQLSLQWEFMTGNGAGIAPLSGPALSDGVLYVASQAQTTFTALDAATGASRWMATCMRSRLTAWEPARPPGRCRSARWERTRRRPSPMEVSTSEVTTAA